MLVDTDSSFVLSLVAVKLFCFKDHDKQYNFIAYTTGILVQFFQFWYPTNWKCQYAFLAAGETSFLTLLIINMAFCVVWLLALKRCGKTLIFRMAPRLAQHYGLAQQRDEVLPGSNFTEFQVQPVRCWTRVILKASKKVWPSFDSPSQQHCLETARRGFSERSTKFWFRHLLNLGFWTRLNYRKVISYLPGSQ